MLLLYLKKNLLLNVHLLLNLILSTSRIPGYLFSSKKSLRISIEEYQPVKGVAGNCNPPISVRSHETPGNGYHSSPRLVIPSIL